MNIFKKLQKNTQPSLGDILGDFQDKLNKLEQYSLFQQEKQQTHTAEAAHLREQANKAEALAGVSTSLAMRADAIRRRISALIEE